MHCALTSDQKTDQDHGSFKITMLRIDEEDELAS